MGGLARRWGRKPATLSTLCGHRTIPLHSCFDFMFLDMDGDGDSGGICEEVRKEIGNIVSACGHRAIHTPHLAFKLSFPIMVDGFVQLAFHVRGTALRVHG